MNKGMIKVSVMYPNEEGKHFDMDYYVSKHIPMVGELLGDALKGVTVEKGLAVGAPGSIATYAGIANMYFTSVEAFGKAFGPHSAEIMKDVPNYTNMTPVMQISEVMM